MKEFSIEDNTQLDLTHGHALKVARELIKQSSELSGKEQGLVLDFFAKLYKFVTFNTSRRLKRIGLTEVRELGQSLKIPEDTLVDMLIPPINITKMDANIIYRAIDKYIQSNYEDAKTLLDSTPSNATEDTLKDDARDNTKIIFNEKSANEQRLFAEILSSLLDSVDKSMRNRMKNKKYRSNKFKEAEELLKELTNYPKVITSLATGDMRFKWTLGIIKKFQEFKALYAKALVEYDNNKRLDEINRQKKENEQLKQILNNPTQKYKLIESLVKKLGKNLNKLSAFSTTMQNLTGVSYNQAERERMFRALKDKNGWQDAPDNLVQIVYKLKQQGKLK